MEGLVPWAELLEVLQPFYPQVGPQGGRPPYPLEVMLRTHLLQLWNSRSDQGTQDDLLDIIPFRAFSKIDALAQGQAPDATTILRFRHFLEQHDLARKLFEKVVEQLEAEGLLMRQGTIVDSTHIQAPCSTKNKERKRDHQMHQSRKGNQWFFGMKCHVGVDKGLRTDPLMVVTAGNVSDVTVAAELFTWSRGGALWRCGLSRVREERGDGRQSCGVPHCHGTWQAATTARYPRGAPPGVL